MERKCGGMICIIVERQVRDIPAELLVGPFLSAKNSPNAPEYMMLHENVALGVGSEQTLCSPVVVDLMVSKSRA
jgi:hypothetical protein